MAVDGVLTSQEFKCFWEKFLRMWKAVPGASEAEAHRLLLGCFLPKERERMVGETKKILRRQRRMLLTGWPAEMTATQMRAWLSKIGVQAGKVRLVPGRIEVDPKKEQDTQYLMESTSKEKKIFCQL